MSLDTWKAEFYKVDAQRVAPKNAADHSILKWRGLHPSNLKKHGLNMSDGILCDNHNRRALKINEDTCALCEHHARPGCITCPLFAVRGGFACDRRSPDEINRELLTPYHALKHTDDPRPMLLWLRRARKWQQNQQAKERTHD